MNTDELLDILKGRTRHPTLAFMTTTWESFRDARTAAIAALGTPTGSYTGTGMAYLVWQGDAVTVQLWTPSYRPRPRDIDHGEAPPDLEELLAVPDED